MTISFTDKQIEVTITLGTGQFGVTQGDTVTLSGLRMFADLSAPCGDTAGAAAIRIFGLTQSMMNKLSVIGPFGQAKPKNTILIAAGDSINGMSIVFEGFIYSAWADYNAAPDAIFNVIGNVQWGLALKPVGAVSYPGAADVGTILSNMANVAGLGFVNSGVTVQLSNPYFHGTIITQIQTCCRAARINYKIEKNILSIWPQGGVISDSIPRISPDTGMVGYPSFSSQGMTIKTSFNPHIVQGGNIQVTSSLEMANGIFNVHNLIHNISCLAPGGPWFSIFDCNPYVQ